MTTTIIKFLYIQKYQDRRFFLSDITFLSEGLRGVKITVFNCGLISYFKCSNFYFHLEGKAYIKSKKEENTITSNLTFVS